jgi:hypothetical protein
MGILVNKPGASDGSGNQLIAWAKTGHLLQTQVPGLELGTFPSLTRSPCARVEGH